MSSGIELTGLDELDFKINEVLKEFPQKRSELHHSAGNVILKKVKENTPYNSKRKKGTHLKDAIVLKVGSKGGYAVVRADYSKAPHAHLVEDGHMQKDSKGNITGDFVKGKHMFKIGAEQANSELIDIAEKFASEIVGDLK